MTRQERFIRETGLLEAAFSNDFVLMAPEASSSWLGKSWNSGVSSGHTKEADPDDMLFIRTLIAHLRDNHNFGGARVHVLGFSNGAIMAEALGCLAPDLFHSVISVAGVVALRPGGREGIQRCDKSFNAFSQGLSVLKIHGDTDGLIPWEGSTFLGFPNVIDDFHSWARRCKCLERPKRVSIASEIEEVRYSLCLGNTSVAIVKGRNLGHYWLRSGAFDFTQYIFSFLTAQ